jgi:hypothetical protein
LFIAPEFFNILGIASERAGSSIAEGVNAMTIVKIGEVVPSVHVFKHG